MMSTYTLGKFKVLHTKETRRKGKERKPSLFRNLRSVITLQKELGLGVRALYCFSSFLIYLALCLHRTNSTFSALSASSTQQYLTCYDIVMVEADMQKEFVAESACRIVVPSK